MGRMACRACRGGFQSLKFLVVLAVLKVCQLPGVAFSAGLWDVRIIYRALQISGFLYTGMRFLFGRLFGITLMADLACHSFQSMDRFRPLLIIRCGKLSGSILMALKGTANVLLKML